MFNPITEKFSVAGHERKCHLLRKNYNTLANEHVLTLQSIKG